MDNISISKMEAEDVSEVFEIENNLLQTASYEKILSTLKSDTLSYYVIKVNTEIVGFYEVSIIPPETELYDIAIKENFQGKGLSNKLMDDLLERCKQNKIRTIFLEVNNINIKAINLYKKFGFEAYSTRKNYYGNNDAILMKLQI